MSRQEEKRSPQPQLIATEVLPPLPERQGAEARVAALERMVAARDQRIVLLELHQQETDHRIKNSLQVVAGLVNIQARAHRALPGAELVERIALVARIHDLLSRRQANLVDLGGLLIELSGTTARLLDGSRSPSIEVDTIECSVPSEPAAAMAIMVHEFLLNVFKHAGREGGRTHVAVRLRRSSARTLSVVIEDDGGGSPPDMEAATTGLGLTLIKSIARAVGATIRSEATAVGCRFTVEMPVAPDGEASLVSAR